MGAHDFLIFYFVHMVLKSLRALFFIDSGESVFQSIKKKSRIELSHFALLFAMSTVSSLLILVSYFTIILLFDYAVSPKTINMDFFKLYALTIIGNLLMPFAGVVQAKGNVWVKVLLLRGHHLMNLICILAFFAMGIDGALLPYVWLLTSMVMALLIFVFGIFYFANIEKIGSALSVDRMKGKMISRNIVDHSARRTNNRATFLATKGVISAFLGPFAGLALKSIRFDDRNRRKQYVAKIKDRGLVNRFDDQIPDAVKRGLANDRPFWIVLTLAVLVLVLMIVLRGTLDAFLLLGLLVLASKMMSISLRVLVLNMLISRGFTSIDVSAA